MTRSMQPAAPMRPTGKRGCVGHKRNGDLCDGPAVAGTHNCRMHPGMPVEQLKAKGQIVLTLRAWGEDDIPDDPAFMVLKMATVTHRRQQVYEAEMVRVVAESGLELADALVGDTIVVDKDGSPHKVGEYIRGIVELEHRERKLTAELSLKVLGAQVQERLTRVQEQIGELVAATMIACLAEWGLDDPQHRGDVHRQLSLITAGRAVAS